MDVKRLLSCSLLNRMMVVDVGLDVIITTGLELNKVGESSCLAEYITVVYDCPEGDSGIASRSSRPGRDGSGTALGMGKEACGVIDNDGFTGRIVRGVDIDEWNVDREDCYFPAFKYLSSL